MTATISDTYPLGRSEAETRRLVLQNQIFGPLTRQFLQAAGINRGMKVLDLGSGAGDVAMLLADLVGPEGEVVGVDMNADILETARARVSALRMDERSIPPWRCARSRPAERLRRCRRSLDPDVRRRPGRTAA